VIGWPVALGLWTGSTSRKEQVVEKNCSPHGHEVKKMEEGVWVPQSPLRVTPQDLKTSYGVPPPPVVPPWGPSCL
jgi:hypothetical protein